MTESAHESGERAPAPPRRPMSGESPEVPAVTDDAPTGQDVTEETGEAEPPDRTRRRG
ncbi:hypothetical protein B0I31_104242 [Saccharothrix carnea]|uniref:Uncharacterized protein n=1 Tax=Saccharothrix carnea TaxID=1280637 RepID=A0A2P8IBV9_SACCR|nr:hypothetical protein [Saccharothrix carnea]PSL55951.1 hypothetical protein B0I31_104242 [Saccharothrix carnea]